MWEAVCPCPTDLLARLGIIIFYLRYRKPVPWSTEPSDLAEPSEGRMSTYCYFLAFHRGARDQQSTNQILIKQ